MIKLHFPIDPIAKGRARMTRSGYCYTPQKTRNFEETIKHLAMLQMHSFDHGLFDCAVRVRGFFFIKRPQRPKNDLPIGRPDLDNLQKSLFDSLNGVVWKDDCQICDCDMGKRYSTKGSITLYVEAFK